MHILVTADTVGGVWTYTRELVTSLALRGNRITLVSFGGIPTPNQTEWLEKLKNVAYYPTAFSLEWMQDSASDIAESTEYLSGLIAEHKPDLLHFSQYCYGAIETSIPKIVVAHSDVITWYRTIRGAEPNDDWTRWYRAIVLRGLAGADTVVAPSRWMLDSLEECYGKQPLSCVVYNGRTPTLFNPFVSKHKYAASVGRLWDEAKQSSLLMQLAESPLPICLAGAESLAGESASELSDDAKQNVQLRGVLSEGEMRQFLSRAAIYIAASKYEPFGLAPLEAALSRCALVASDIPSFHEIWGDAAFYFRAGDVDSLREALDAIHSDRDLRLECANRALERARQRYTAEHMTQQYLQLYSALLERRVTAA